MGHVTVETHTREHHRIYGSEELTNIVAWALADATKVDLHRLGVEYSVTFADENGGMTAKVVIVEDLMPQVAAQA